MTTRTAVRARTAIRARGPAGCAEQGSVVVWLLLLAPVLLGFAGLVWDGGRQVSARQDAANLAEQAARTAVDQLDVSDRQAAVDSQFRRLDPAAARARGCGYVAAARPGAVCTLTVTGDGQVQVQVRITTATVLLRVVGVNRLQATGAGQARPAFGATKEAR